MLDGANAAGHYAASQTLNPTYENAQSMSQPSGGGASAAAGMTPGDKAILGDLQNLEAHKNDQNAQMNDAKMLLAHVLVQLTPQGRQEFSDAITSGKYRTPADIQAFNAKLKKYAAMPLGDVTIATADALAMAAAKFNAQQGPATAAAGSAKSAYQPVSMSTGGYQPPATGLQAPPQAVPAY